MNCAIPRAPAGLVTNGLKLLSAYSCAASRVAETFQRCAARVSIGAYSSGTNAGSPIRRSPSPAPGGRRVERAFSV
jgi:hypothetical protein